jgi:hypothetical protein
MNWLYYNGLLDTDKGFLYWLKKSMKFKNILMNDLNKNKLNIQKICSEYFLNYNIIYTYYEILINNIISILSANIFSDMDYNIINPLIKASELNIDLMKIISKNTIEEKLNICFFMAQPRNFSITYDNNYINMYRTKCNISYNKSLKKLNTLCNNISSMIGYYQLKLDNNMNYMSIIYNIDIMQLTSYYPIYYNPIYIKNVYNKTIYNMAILEQFYSSSWDRVISAVRNTYSNSSYDRFPLNSTKFPIIQQYIKNISYTKI